MSENISLSDSVPVLESLLDGAERDSGPREYDPPANSNTTSNLMLT